MERVLAEYLGAPGGDRPPLKAAILALGLASADQGELAETALQPGDSADALIDGAAKKLMTAAERTKLAGIQDGATANATDAQLRDRSTHTGTQAIATISGLQGALDGKVNSSLIGVANGIVPLDAAAKIAASFLPSYVDDVIEVANFSALPSTGETGKIYVTLDANLEYRWSGSTYVQLVSSPGSTDAVPEGSVNQYFTTARVRAVVLTGLSLATSTAITATDSVLSAFGKLQAQITALASGKLDATANAVSATKLATARNINGVAFDGMANITIADATKEPTIAAGTSAQYWDGTKTFKDFAASVIAAALTGLSLATSTAVVATDTVLGAIGKLQAQVSLRAPLASPTFTGTPAAPTAAAGTSTTQIATTAFVASSLGGFGVSAADRTALKALNTATYKVALVGESGREGMFTWETGNFSALATADTLEGVCVKANAIAITAGAWIRVFNGDIQANWFGASATGATGDAAAIQCGMRVSAALGGGVVRLMRGVHGLEATLTHIDGVFLLGQGMSVSELRALGNYPVYTANGTSSSVFTEGGVSHVSVRANGLGTSTNVGVQIAWCNRLQFHHIRFFGCYTCFDFSNVWQVEAYYLHGDGAGTDQNAIGFYGREVDPSNQNNAVIAHGCMFQNVSTTGYRLINFNGSKFTSCEVAGSGGKGWHLGNPTTGTEMIRWGHFANCLADTCVDSLLVVEKAGAAAAKQIQFNGFWCGTSSATNGIHIKNSSLVQLSGLMIASVAKTAILLEGCSRVSINGGCIDTYDSDNNGDVGIILTDCTHCIVNGLQVFGNGTSARSIGEGGTSDFNVITNNDMEGGGTFVGTHTVVKGNSGVLTHNQGLATVPTTQSFITVTHGLARAPVSGEIQVTPAFNNTSQGISAFWVDTLTATTFTLRVNANPANALGFHWSADVSRG